MRRDAEAFLVDVLDAADAIVRYLGDRDQAAYLSDDMLRAAVERRFTIVGEASNRLLRHYPDLAGTIPELGKAVAFRNILVHGYAEVDDGAVWLTIKEHLPGLRERVVLLLAHLEQRR